MNKPDSVSADGLFQTLEKVLPCLGINTVNRDTCNKLVRIGTDGTTTCCWSQRIGRAQVGMDLLDVVLSLPS